MNLNFTLPESIKAYADQYGPAAQTVLESGLKATQTFFASAWNVARNTAYEQATNLSPHVVPLAAGAFALLGLFACCQAGRACRKACIASVWTGVAMGSVAIAAGLFQASRAQTPQ